MFKKENLPQTIGLAITFLFIIPCLTRVSLHILQSI